MKWSKPPRFHLVAVFSICYFALVGCVHLAETFGIWPKKPDVLLVDVQIKSISLSKINVDVVINVKNNDDRELEVADLNFELLLMEKKMGSGSMHERISVRANSEQKVSVPVIFQTDELMAFALNLMSGRGRENARIRGETKVRTLVGLVTIPFDHEIGK